ncbi:hypothetical protein [Emcibacter sp. SYSU 3D8]|uniref:hypothetical protein n=1 Tax=Emcibacter sp. SYSU 3D8 TaxID=3133969 RepID=UPI0031FECC16
MRHIDLARGLVLCALALTGLSMVPVSAQEPARAARDFSATGSIRSPEEIQSLRQRILRNRAVVLETPAIPAGEAPRAAQPATPQAPVATSAPLELGDTRFIKLDNEAEKTTRDIVKLSIPGSLRGQAAVFQGVVQTTDSQAKELILKAVAFPRAPLRYNAATRRFEGGVSVGVIEVDGSGARTLSRPIAFQVLGPVASDPETLSIGTTAPPYRDIKVAAEAPDAEVEVTVVSSVAPAGERMVLKVRPSLSLTVTPPRIQGWGLETADVLVSAQAADAARANMLQLSSTMGRLSATEARLDKGGNARVSIRSESVGTGQVSGRGAGLDGASAKVEYIFPWRFLGAALVGGVAGGLLRKRSRSKTAGAFAKSMGIAVLSAAIVVGLYVLGINLVGFALPAHGGEVLVFVVAALGALYGTRLLAPAVTA